LWNNGRFWQIITRIISNGTSLRNKDLHTTSRSNYDEGLKKDIVVPVVESNQFDAHLMNCCQMDD